MLLYNSLLLLVTTVVVSERHAITKGHSLSSEFRTPTLRTIQLCEDEWFMCELHSSGW